jgi:DnaJ like chaperone protein
VLHWWNRLRRLSCDPPAQPGLFAPVVRFERGAYLRAVTIVAAKLAKADGPVRRSEINSFKRLFLLEQDDVPTVGPLFDLARETPEGYEPFAVQLAEMLVDNPGAAEELFDRLHGVALADGGLTREECDCLGVIARALGVEAHWQALQARSQPGGDPYEVLGIRSDVSDKEVRLAWQRLSRRYHPDAAASRGEGESDHDRMAAVNSAYRRIMRMRRRRVSS